MDALFVAWQEPESREWIPVGKLTRVNHVYKFAYTRGALRAANFQAFGRLSDLYATYESDTLFPVFSNRVIAKSRPEYRDYLRWIGLSDLDSDPLSVLAMTGGVRGTDSIELFPQPKRTDNNRYQVTFFARGLRHLPKSSVEAIAELSPGDTLKLLHDCQNGFDEFAICLATLKPSHLVGYCPKYYARDISRFLHTDAKSVDVKVKCVNLDAPLDMRLLCSVTAPWEPNYAPFENHDDFKLLSREPSHA
ncbi:DNA-binding protein [bacterium M00.F.Ca.ET.228.01.1.1]|uniref:HIRAN domain-containing protein n=1 Tax=Paraburkholderia phenoliruptrix TaxID=252970 RepID=UPI0010928163|nr:HIRAN domain-containing protein [Paraburkholderia phenoliruptrix]TGP45034.1 DNA-binding protein [bacterium M00.F.Ca.ET.228.01.1.1]TGS02917.1 DNA-binding protein [bacterium M00.F.Ca.ET.191.01.1.1]TGU06299.1 DNA-binding protein [bacterium M00.F.Ca.ET.155.01.1.1]MBW0448912.1 HIRAN domain-containing protein [Paraburkholderia phenoliruptrix]MBW9097889.1 HIRAN domain-containing protein [Paraburkholderia phenoliruptrix]